MEANFERDQLRPGTVLPPLPPLAHSSIPDGVEIVSGGVSVVLPDHGRGPDSSGLAKKVEAIVAPPPAVIGELSGVYCECGLEMFRLRDLADGRTSYRCQCGKGVAW